MLKNLFLNNYFNIKLKVFKKIIQSLFQKLGVRVIKSPSSGFEYLLNQRRYNKTQISLNNTTFEIADSHSFYYSHREIFIDEIYKFICNNDNPVIVDCGSNYGTSILYFKQLYPNAHIVGVEADPSIFEILEINIDKQNYNNITLLNKAISTDQGPVEFYGEGADGGRIHTNLESKNTYEVETIPLDDLIENNVDFLKMDIEGSEADVICHSNKLKKVNEIFIEYHSFVDGDQRLGDLLSCLTENGFRYYIQSQFCSKKPFMKVESQLGMDLQLNIFAKRN